MNPTPDQLTEIERLAGLFMRPLDIALIVNIDPNILRTKESAGYLSYQRGKLLAEAEVKKSVLTMAKQGSSPAQTLACRFLDDMNVGEIDL